MDVIQDLTGVEREREKEVSWNILRINFSQLGEGYAAIKEIYNRFTSKREDLIELLGSKGDGELTEGNAASLISAVEFYLQGLHP